MIAVGALLTGLWAFGQPNVTATSSRVSTVLQWTLVAAPTPPSNTALSSNVSTPLVQCSSTGNCIAVGLYGVGTTNAIYAAIEGAGTWQPGLEIASTNGPTVLTALDCPSLGNCTLVGTQSDSGNTFGFSLTETGGAWGNVVTIPTPSNASTQGAVLSLDALSCTATGSCELAGTYTSSSSPVALFVATEAAGAWSGAVTIDPAGSGGPVVALAPSSLSCTSAGNCMLAGGVTREPSYAQQAFAVTEHAGVWGSSTLIPLPVGANTSSPNSTVSAMSCMSAGNCLIVGTYEDTNFNTQGFSLRQVNGSWKPVSTLPLPADALSAGQLVGNLQLSCSTSSCGIIGTYQSSTGSGVALFGSLVGNGSTAPPTSIALPANYSPGAQSLNVQLSCSGLSCTAYGDYPVLGASGTIYVPFQASEAGGVWSPISTLATPAGTTSTSLSASLVCTGAGDCIGGGSAIRSSGATEPFIEAEQSNAWLAPTVLTTPTNAIPSPQTNTATAAWCASIGNCVEVGGYVTPSGTQAGFVATETSGTWSPGIDIMPPTDANSALPTLSPQALTCTSSGSCTISGAYVNTRNDMALFVTSSNGGQFAQSLTVPLPSNAIATGQQPVVQGLACVSTGNCELAGTYVDQSHFVQGLVANETNGSWTAASEVPLPANASSAQGVTVGGLACTGAGSCVLTGSYQTSLGGTEALVMNVTNGSPQRAQELALPANAITGRAQLANATGVGCPAASSCEVVGTYVSSTNQTFGFIDLESNGVWQTSRSLPLPANASAAPTVSHIALSCLGVGSCIVDGSYLTRAGAVRPFAVSQTTPTTGTRLVALSLPVPSNARPSAPVTPTNLTCPSPGSCTIAGTYTTATGAPGLYVLNQKGGNSAAVTPLALPSGTTETSGNSLTCPKAGACTLFVDDLTPIRTAGTLVYSMA
jgi:hypothetical protein